MFLSASSHMDIIMKFNTLIAVSAILGASILSWCTASSLGAKTTPEEVTDQDYSFTYDADNSEIVNIIKESTKELGWVKLEEHHDVIQRKNDGIVTVEFRTRKTITSEYKKSWYAVSPESVVDDLAYIKVRTPVTLFSYGADIYIGVASEGDTTTIKYSGSTTQVVEKDKMVPYLNELSSLVSNKAKKLGTTH